MYTAGRAKGWRKMKKNLLILIVFFITSILFALNSEYFNNTKIDILYVDSIEGLRIRDTPGLTGNRIGVLYDRMVVKVVEIGDETVIDGIKSKWIKILLPIETIKNDKNIYGWVFGGYLTDKLEPFSTDNWSDDDLKRYLCRFPWITGRAYRKFESSGAYVMGLLESGAGGSGKYSVSIKNKTIKVRASYGDEDFQSEIKQDVFQIIDIKENALTLRLNDVEGELVPSFTNRYFLSCLTSGDIKITEFEEPSLKALMYSFTSDMIKEITGGKNYEILFNNLIKMGIPIEDSEYMKKYKQYWDK